VGESGPRHASAGVQEHICRQTYVIYLEGGAREPCGKSEALL